MAESTGPLSIVFNLYSVFPFFSLLMEQAKPIPRTFNPPEACHLSTAPLTTPITPNLRTMRRARNEPYDMGKGGASSNLI